MVVRIGILGAAAIAPTAVINPAKDLENVEVVAVAARNPERAAKYAAEHGIPRVHASYEELLADDQVDLVYIPTPASLHGTWTKKAIAAGKDVLCEKPFTANAEEAKEVALAAAEQRVKVYEAMHSLYHPLWREAASVITSGEIGQVKEASAVFNYGIDDRADIRWNPDLAGGAMMDLGVYPLTLLRFLFPDLELISAYAESEDGVDSSLEGRYRRPDGSTVGLFTNMAPGTPEEQLLIVRGSQGSLTLDMFVHPQNGGTLTVDSESGRRVVEASGADSYTRMLKAVARAVEEDEAVPTDAAAAVKTMEAIDELYLAAGLDRRQPAVTE